MMHFAILDIEDKTDEHGSYVSYGISVNGGYHSSIRYRQLRELHEQLKKDFGDRVPDKFPPKKLLSLTPIQCEERREQLEKYLQAISQDPVLVESKTFVKFLLKAQKESNKVEEEDTKLDIYLMNGKNFQVNVRNTDSTDHVMQEAMSQIKLSQNMIQYFSLFLVKREEDTELAVIRKLQGFESPALVLLRLTDEHRLVIRKNFWASNIEDELYKDKIALNLLFVQAVSDVERDWVITTPETLEELTKLKTRNERKEFNPCEMNFPESDSHVIICIGGYELYFKLIGTQNKKGKEGCFKVTRIRCWRVVSSAVSFLCVERLGLPASNFPPERDSKKGEVVTRIAFEYLFSKDKLQWVTITSEQAMLMSLCLQSMVDEIVQTKAKANSKKPDASKAAREQADPSQTKEQSETSTKTEAKKKQDLNSSDEDSGGEKTTEKQNGQSTSEKRSSKKKKKQKKIVSVKNEVFAQDIQDEDL